MQSREGGEQEETGRRGGGYTLWERKQKKKMREGVKQRVEEET